MLLLLKPVFTINSLYNVFRNSAERDIEADKKALLELIKDMKHELPDAVYDPQPASAAGW